MYEVESSPKAILGVKETKQIVLLPGHDTLAYLKMPQSEWSLYMALRGPSPPVFPAF
jgi:hypothetical protein